MVKKTSGDVQNQETSMQNEGSCRLIVKCLFDIGVKVAYFSFFKSDYLLSNVSKISIAIYIRFNFRQLLNKYSGFLFIYSLVAVTLLVRIVI